MRAASVLGIEAGSLWQTILPIQIFGIVLALAHSVLAGWQEKRRGAGLHGKLAETEGVIEMEEKVEEAKENELARPKLFIFNILLTIAAGIFMVGSASALPTALWRGPATSHLIALYLLGSLSHDSFLPSPDPF